MHRPSSFLSSFFVVCRRVNQISRSRDAMSMNSGKLRALLGGNPFRPWPFDPEHFPIDRQWHHNGNGSRGSLQLLIDHLYTYPGADDLPI